MNFWWKNKTVKRINLLHTNLYKSHICCEILLNEKLMKAVLGFASGVMIAASVWSLLIPAMDLSSHMGKFAFFPAALGFLLGMFFLLFLDLTEDHQEKETLLTHLLNILLNCFQLNVCSLEVTQYKCCVKLKLTDCLFTLILHSATHSR